MRRDNSTWIVYKKVCVTAGSKARS